MEVWILFNEEIESPTSEAFEIRRFLAEGREMGIDVKVFHPEQFDLLVTSEDRESVLIDGSLMPLPDFLLPRTYVIETGYFPLAVIRQLERLGVRVFNDSASIERVADKLHTHQVLAEHGLPTPNTMLAKFPVDLDLVENSLGFPVVVKTLLGVNGTGVFLIENRDSFTDLMGLIAETTPNIQLIFQQFVAMSKGRDLRLFVVDGQVVASMERRAREGGFKANYSQGGSVREFQPDDVARELAIKTAEVLDLQVAGIDLLFTDGGYTICEANSFPGFKGLESCCNVNVPQEIYGAMLRRLQAEKSVSAVSAGA
ncbi:MAG: RimK family alpha-L-glutamate ligase [Alphaproteobacteria bacterium]|nr:RimK family alpha-L-glutamate ligase [Alphaproteobacteria bacterium]